jgi:Ras GTPase-activating-like protein IQGAP2/3
VTTELKRQRPGGVRVGGVEDAVARLSVSAGTNPPSQGKTTTTVPSKSGTTSKHSALGLGRPSALAVPSNVGRVEPGKRVLSIGKTDGRILGRHLPRVVSASRELIKDKPRVETTATATQDVTRSRPMAPASRVAEIRNGLMRKSLALERDQSAGVSKQASTPVKNAATTAPLVAHPRMPASPVKRLIPDGRGMAGLTGKSVTVPMSPRPDLLRQDSAASVSGYGSRLRLSRGLPLSSSSVNLAPAPLPSKRLNTNWMDKQRKALVAYEYLCHVGEAQQWIEGCLGEELGWGVVEMEEEMRDGVALAKLVRVYEGEQVVKTIWEVCPIVDRLVGC